MPEEFPDPESRSSGMEFHSEDRPVPDCVRKDTDRIREWIRRVVGEYDHRIDQLHVYFCSDAFLLRMNRKFLGHDYYTDILTFPESSKDREGLSGDLYLSLDRLKDHAAERKLKYCDEILRVMIHGVLHLTGQDDATEEDREKMRELEDKALNLYYSTSKQ